jgi:hypothetical protein
MPHPHPRLAGTHARVPSDRTLEEMLQNNLGLPPFGRSDIGPEPLTCEQLLRIGAELTLAETSTF